MKISDEQRQKGMRIHKSSLLVKESHPIRIAIVGNARSTSLGNDGLGKYLQILLNGFWRLPPNPGLCVLRNATTCPAPSNSVKTP